MLYTSGNTNKAGCSQNKHPSGAKGAYSENAGQVLIWGLPRSVGIILHKMVSSQKPLRRGVLWLCHWACDWNTRVKI